MESKKESNTYLTLAQAEENLLMEKSTITSVKRKTKKTSTKVSKKISTTVETCIAEDLTQSIVGADDARRESNSSKEELMNSAQKEGYEQEDKSETKLAKKKSKRSATSKQNISMKSSFNKFDNLEKRNRIHVRSNGAEKVQKILTDAPDAPPNQCHKCSKTVYKMEEIKAEKHIYHRNCFRCHECTKQLKVDNYQSHEGVLYCPIHFKLLFAPKVVEEAEPEAPKKPQLIISENVPAELPPDVIRASSKPDLGLEELQKLNVRSRFEVFENQTTSNEQAVNQAQSQRIGKSNSSIQVKLAKLKAQGFDVGEINNTGDESLLEEEDSRSDQSDVDSDDLENIARQSNLQRECPIGIGKAMEDIKSKFEKGPSMRKEERREERKQEIQNIRSRLFMGKQARIKEMYQQAVSESEQAKTSVGKKPDVEIDAEKAKSLKKRFETGDIFKNSSSEHENDVKMQVEPDVIESGISKQSRSIFLELDANASLNKAQEDLQSKPISPRILKPIQNKIPTEQTEQKNVVKYDENPEDVEIKTSEISQKFKFFETYRPETYKKKEFRITPPRDGVVKMPSPDNDKEDVEEENDKNILVKSHTTSKMLDKFRNLEQNGHRNNMQEGRKPLKCFTPPPDDGKRYYEPNYSDQEETDDYEDEEEDGEEEMDEETRKNLRRAELRENDVALKEAEAAARAKLLRAKFEKWEAHEIEREMKDDQVDVYSRSVSDDTNIESTKSIRQRFENMNYDDKPLNRQRYRVNRFV